MLVHKHNHRLKNRKHKIKMLRKIREKKKMKVRLRIRKLLRYRKVLQKELKSIRKVLWRFIIIIVNNGQRKNKTLNKYLT